MADAAEDLPGPTDYDPIPVTRRAPGYSLAPKPNPGKPSGAPTGKPGGRSAAGSNFDKENSPGPDYTPKDPPRRPAYSMAGRAKNGEQDESPGPGQYQEMKPFPRPLGAVSSSILKARAPESSAMRIPPAKKVSFSKSTA